MFDTESVQKKIGYVFEDAALLRQAFTHSSYAHENRTVSNERLEFLGDSILNFCIAEYLFKRGGLSEGDLSVCRSRIVSRDPTAEAVRRMDVIDHLICGVGESKNEKSVSVMSDLFEAICAAVYLDSDLYTVEKFIVRHLSFAIDEAVGGHGAVFRLPSRQVNNNIFAGSQEYLELEQRADAEKNKNKKKGGRREPLSNQEKVGGQKSGNGAAGKADKSDKKDKADKTAKTDKSGKADKKSKKEKGGLKAEKQTLKKEPKETKDKSKENKKAAAKTREKPVKPAAVVKADYKSLLQNHAQRVKLGEIEYRLTGMGGAAHKPSFDVSVFVGGSEMGAGAGSRKKDAEQAAARAACAKLNLNISAEEGSGFEF